jgi:hypothetical protein
MRLHVLKRGVRKDGKIAERLFAERVVEYEPEICPSLLTRE